MSENKDISDMTRDEQIAELSRRILQIAKLKLECPPVEDRDFDVNKWSNKGVEIEKPARMLPKLVKVRPQISAKSDESQKEKEDTRGNLKQFLSDL